MKAAVCMALVLLLGAAADHSRPIQADRIRIAEAVHMAQSLGDRIWPGWSSAPFAILLVTPEQEFLFNHPAPSQDFVLLEYDSLLDSEIYVRDRTFDKSLLATFPAVGGIPTVVIGQPKYTAASTSTRWVLTLLHEHFHQWQQSQEDYYSSVGALGLAGDDTSGRWMLDYPFPYDSVDVGLAFLNLCRALRATLLSVAEAGFEENLSEYVAARHAFRETLSEKDYAYFSFQIWQEGVARYTEYRLARLAVGYRPTPAFLTLSDASPFEEDAGEIREHILAELLRTSLKRQRRSAFYHVGAGEAMLLDVLRPGWKAFYFKRKFYLEEYLNDLD